MAASVASKCLCQAYVFNGYSVKLWAELSDEFIRTYQDRSTLYDIINILFYDQIHKMELTHPQIAHGIVFVHGTAQTIYGFEKASDRNAFYNAILIVLSLQSKKPSATQHHESDYNTANILFSSNVLHTQHNTKQLLYATLSSTQNTNKLNLYLRRMVNPENTMRTHTIDLDKYSSIQCTTLHSAHNSLFKYSFKLQDDKNGGDLVFSFKKNNDRFEWVTHIQWLFQHRDKNDAITSLCNVTPYQTNQSIKMDSKNRIAVLTSALDLYESYMAKSHNDKAFRVILNDVLNTTYLELLDAFSDVATVDESALGTMRQQCNSQDDVCVFIKRYRKNRDRRIQSSYPLLHLLMDKMHCFLCHGSICNEQTKDNKFMISTSTNNDEKEDIELKNEDDVLKQPQFAFGEAFSYYDIDETSKKKNDIIPKYETLRDELAKNIYYAIGQAEYNELYTQASNIQKTIRFRNIRARDCGFMNRIAGIDANDPISINHIIALLTYCNNDALQRIFKRHTRRISMKETFDDIGRRQSHIAHWTRYLMESCFFFGEVLPKETFLFSGMNTKLLFNSFNVLNFSPLSTTTSILVASGFAAHNGIILKLKNGGNDCKYFDMMPISDFVHERELFFCGTTTLEICDIMINAESNENTILAFKLLECILSGNLFYYSWNSELFKEEVVHILIGLLTEYIHNTNQKQYFNELMTSFMASYADRNDENDPYQLKAIFINIPQLNKLNNAMLKTYFVGTKRTLFGCSKFNSNVVIREIKEVHHFVLNKHLLNQLSTIPYGEHGEIRIARFMDGNHQFEIKIAKQPTQDGDYFALVVYLKPQAMCKMSILFDIVCTEIEYQRIKRYALLCKETDYYDGFSAFKCSDIASLNCLSMECVIRVCDLKY
eukprot:88243_1